jgi:hypothetical protein
LDSVYSKCGIDNFAALREFTTYVCGDKSSKDGILNLISKYEEYVKNGLPGHLCDVGNCKSHSYSYLLGSKIGSENPLNSVFTQYCIECDNETLIVKNLESEIATMTFEILQPGAPSTFAPEPHEHDQESKVKVR